MAASTSSAQITKSPGCSAPISSASSTASGCSREISLRREHPSQLGLRHPRSRGSSSAGRLRMSMANWASPRLLAASIPMVAMRTATSSRSRSRAQAMAARKFSYSRPERMTRSRSFHRASVMSFASSAKWSRCRSRVAIASPLSTSRASANSLIVSSSRWRTAPAASRVTSMRDLAVSASMRFRASYSGTWPTTATSGAAKPPWNTDSVWSIDCSAGASRS